MPFTPKQHRLFEAAAHNPAVAAKYGIPQNSASSMASEGVKTSVPSNAVNIARRGAPPSGPTALRRSPITEEIRKKTMVKALRGG